MMMAMITPAMEAGIADHVWSIEEIVSLLKGQVVNHRPFVPGRVLDSSAGNSSRNNS
jgi:hypothetical protein